MAVGDADCSHDFDGNPLIICTAQPIPIIQSAVDKLVVHIRLDDIVSLMMKSDLVVYGSLLIKSISPQMDIFNN